MSKPSVTPVDVKPRSRDVTDGNQKAAARAMLRAVGLTDEDWDKPQIGLANAWNEVTPCNATLRRLADSARQGVRASGGVALEFGTITVSDGISMGHEGMRASLVSREVITDSVETVIHAERMDGFIGLAGCDKSIPAMLMAAARLNLPSVFVYNGSTLPGVHDGKNIDITTVLRQSARALRERCPKRNSAKSSALRALAKVRVAACSPPTPCRQSLKRSG